MGGLWRSNNSCGATQGSEMRGMEQRCPNCNHRSAMIAALGVGRQQREDQSSTRNGAKVRFVCLYIVLYL